MRSSPVTGTRVSFPRLAVGKTRTWLAFALCTAALAAAGPSFAPAVRADVPEPAITPTSWELTFKYTAPERIILQLPGKEPQAYWFVRYTVTNNSDQDVLFTPSFQMITDTGQIIQAGKNVPNDVFKKIKETYRDAFLESPVQILGRLLQGEDNAKNGVAIFSGVDADARHVRILITGLSGETVTVDNPLTHKPVFLQKALELSYDFPGQAIGIDPNPQFKGKRWVMR